MIPRSVLVKLVGEATVVHTQLMTKIVSHCYVVTIEATTIARGVDERMVNLTVKCDRDVAHLKFSTGGLDVRSIRLAQECIVLDKYEHNGSDYEVINYMSKYVVVLL